jgi:alkyl hydroperoxide reductase subunit AhpF
MKQTAVEWLFLQLYEKFEMKGDGLEMDKVLEQAKAMDKQQKIEAYLQGSFDDGPDVNRAEQYYNETYNK